MTNARSLPALNREPTAAERGLARMGRALAHPLRIRILLALAEEDDRSPIQIARELKERIGNVSYHTRYLANLGAIDLVRTGHNRGAVQHFYGLNPALRVALPVARELGIAAVQATRTSRRQTRNGSR